MEKGDKKIEYKMLDQQDTRAFVTVNLIINAAHHNMLNVFQWILRIHQLMESLRLA